MTLFDGEVERIKRFYNSALRMAQEDVASDFTFLEAMGRVPKENREEWANMGVDVAPREDVISRWQKSIEFNHQAACRILRVDRPAWRDFFPSRIKPSTFNNLLDDDDYLMYHDVDIMYKGILRNDFYWEIDYENTSEQSDEGMIEGRSFSRYVRTYGDWIVKTSCYIDGLYHRSNGKSPSCSIELYFDVTRRDYNPYNIIEHPLIANSKDAMREFSPFSFLGIMGDSWIIESSKQADLYKSGFKDIINLFMSTIENDLRGLGIND